MILPRYECSNSPSYSSIHPKVNQHCSDRPFDPGAENQQGTAPLALHSRTDLAPKLVARGECDLEIGKDEPYKEDDEEDNEYEAGYGDQEANIELLLPTAVLATIFPHFLVREQGVVGVESFWVRKMVQGLVS
ncbi:unnamed protein product [Fraxinus pennsylvanica]|uniref:Uncharacterized protein n=1 Tax=Fraxinus pennsylvanica TaxID=56036 RepID=A0AAD2AA33_9LAMI|nr:unnamed protein product [Fraxinus pennsylvanica]